jgi:hypothetical protein
MNWTPDLELSNSRMPIDNTCQHIKAASLIDLFLHVLVIASAIRSRIAWHIPTRRTKGKTKSVNACQCLSILRSSQVRNPQGLTTQLLILAGEGI